MSSKRPTSGDAAVLKKWQTLSSQFNSIGLPSSSWMPVARQDVSNVATKDEYGMSNDEILTTVMAVHSHNDPITETPRHSSGLLGDLGTIASNIIPDVGHTIYALPRGVAELAKQAVTPSSYTTAADLIFGKNTDPSNEKIFKAAGVNPDTYNPSSLSDLGDTFRLVAHTPLLEDLPGISDLANASTSAGRESLMEHPVSSALDVLPVTKGLSEAAGTAAGGLTAEDVASLARDGITAPKTALAALAQGHPVLAAVRGVDRGLLAHFLPAVAPDVTAVAPPSRLGDPAAGPLQTVAAKAATAVGLDPGQRALNAGYARTLRKAQTASKKYIKMVEDAVKGLSPAEQQAIVIADQSGDLSTLTDEQLAARTRLAAISQQATDDALADVNPDTKQPYLTRFQGPHGEDWVKPTDSAVVKALARHAKLNDLKAKRAADLEAATDRLVNANSDVYTQRSRLTGYKENPRNTPSPITQANPTTPVGMTSDPRVEGTVRTPQDIAKTIAPFTSAFTGMTADSVMKAVASTPDAFAISPSATDAATDLTRGLAQLPTLAPGLRKPLVTSVALLVGRDSSIGGLMSQLDAALIDGDIPAARSTLASIDRLMSKKTRVRWDAVPELKPLHDYVRTLRGELKGFAAKSNKDRVKANEATRAAKAWRRTNALHDITTQRVEKSTNAVAREMYRSPPEALHPKIRAMMRDAVKQKYDEQAEQAEADIPGRDRLAKLGVLDTYDKVMNLIDTTGSMQDFKDLVGEDETRALYQDSVNQALELAGNGYHPIYFHQLHNATLDRVVSARMMSDREPTPAQYQDAAFNMNESSLNIVAGLQKAALNVIARNGTREFISNFVNPSLMKQKDVFPAYLDRARALEASGRARTFSSTQLHAVQLMQKEWMPFDAKGRGMRGSISTLSDPTQTLIPANLSSQIASIMKQGNIIESLGGLGKAYESSMKVFRTSVLYGPRHFAHVVIGGLMPLMLDNPMSAFQVVKAFRAMEGTGLIGKIRSGGMFDASELDPGDSTAAQILAQPSNYRPEDVVSFYQGRSYANLLQRVWGATGKKVSDGLEQTESMVQNLYRGMVYLDNRRHGADPMAALQAARRISMDMDDFSPVERTILRQVMPFYSFTRFSAKFLFQLPFDHPLRVAVLSRASNQAQEEWGSGLPQKLQSLFFFGSPDAAGNITAIDTKNMNPFRSIANEFTMQGFISSLNPAVQSLFVAAGMDPYSGTGQLYPDLTYDANTGDLTAKRPANSLLSAAEQYVPELGAVDALVSSSSNLRNTAATNRGQFYRTLMSDLNIPFAVSTYNLPQEYMKTAENSYSAAKSAGDAAVGHDSFNGDVNRFNLIPNSEITGTTTLYTPQQLEADTRALYARTPHGLDPLALQLTDYG